MKAYVVEYFRFGRSMVTLSPSWDMVREQKYFATTEAAENFRDKKNRAMNEVSDKVFSDYPLASVREVELE